MEKRFEKGGEKVVIVDREKEGEESVEGEIGDEEMDVDEDI